MMEAPEKSLLDFFESEKVKFMGFTLQASGFKS
jgi:hypothetical protein